MQWDETSFVIEIITLIYISAWILLFFCLHWKIKVSLVWIWFIWCSRLDWKSSIVSQTATLGHFLLFYFCLISDLRFIFSNSCDSCKLWLWFFLSKDHVIALGKPFQRTVFYEVSSTPRLNYMSTLLQQVFH